MEEYKNNPIEVILIACVSHLQIGDQFIYNSENCANGIVKTVIYRQDGEIGFTYVENGNIVQDSLQTNWYWSYKVQIVRAL